MFTRIRRAFSTTKAPAQRDSHLQNSTTPVKIASLLILLLSLVPAFAGDGKGSKPPRRDAAAPAELLSSPFELALISPLQLAGPNVGVGGLRINLIYGTNAFTRGLDVGVVNDSAGDGCGLEFGLSNGVGGKYSGIQGGLVNFVKSDFGGLQAASVNVVRGSMKGIQLGSANYAAQMNGWQIGVFNIAGSMEGVQIGLINISRDKGGMPFFPVLNVAF